ncbi:acyl carrier protein [Plantactinospora sp. WMMC1484]|uniref:acyl carrier protein n=1 Tax=Plantactinospora sp. WMMC1484 TaxID=3404122 RepID=UPI003BF5173A
MSVEDRLRAIFSEVFRLAGTAEADELDRRSDDRWDSFHHMALMAAIEDGFGVELDPEQMFRVENLESAAAVLREVDAGAR